MKNFKFKIGQYVNFIDCGKIEKDRILRRAFNEIGRIGDNGEIETTEITIDYFVAGEWRNEEQYFILEDVTKEHLLMLIS